VRLAAEANVLLSAVLGGRARLILQSPLVDEILTVERVVAEVQEYAGILSETKGLARDIVLLAVGTLPVTIVERAAYKAAIPDAFRRIGKRGPDDVELLALAIAFRVPVWSNDKDFKSAGVEWLTTASLLERLGISEET
jgi:predicted nucleic acid-binding protein